MNVVYTEEIFIDIFLMSKCLHIIFYIIYNIIMQVVRAIGGEGPAERQMRQEVVRLKQQLQNISMVDQFAMYARIQRKINSLNQQYKAKGTYCDSTVNHVIVLRW